MIRKIAMFVALALLASVPALGDAAVEAHLLEGIVVDVSEGESMLLETAGFGDVLVNVNDATAWDINFDLAPGAYVYVEYDGIMTRSLPPQVTAKGVRSQLMRGAVSEIDEGGASFLLESGEHGMVVVHLPKDRETEMRGNAAKVYFNGIMLLSYPGQVSAGLVVTGSNVEGAVVEIGDGYLMIDAGGEAMRVLLEDGAPLPEGLSEGDYVRAYFEGIPEAVDGQIAQVASAEVVKLNR